MTGAVLAQLYRDHGHAVLRRARRLLRDEEAARDVVQDVFLAIFRSPGAFEQRSSIATYLYSAATHACLNRLRDERTRRRLLTQREPVRSALQPASGEARALAVEILEGLSDDDAVLAIYLYCDELTHDEVAELLGCSRRHVGDLANRLRRRVMERVA